MHTIKQSKLYLTPRGSDFPMFTFTLVGTFVSVVFQTVRTISVEPES